MNHASEPSLPLFVAQFVMLEENVWWDTSPPHDVIRSEQRYYIYSRLFYAENAEQAYDKANDMLDGLGDANHDGVGDRTNILAVGLHQLSEVFFGEDTLTQALGAPYGIGIGTVEYGHPPSPMIRSRNELDVFLQIFLI